MHGNDQKRYAWGYIQRSYGFIYNITDRNCILLQKHETCERNLLIYVDNLGFTVDTCDGFTSIVPYTFYANTMSSAKFLTCFNFRSVSKSLKYAENVVRVSNSLYPGESPSYSASHPDLSYLQIGQ